MNKQAIEVKKGSETGRKMEMAVETRPQVRGIVGPFEFEGTRTP